ncbi:MAG: hypothetical protein V1930_06290 [Pseudomonadota bacterium]
MKKHQYMIVLALALVGGLLGGGLSGRFLSVKPVPARKDPILKKIIVANEFHLVDEGEKDRWVLALSKEGEPSITFINKNGWAPMAMGINRDGIPYFNMIPQPFDTEGPSFIMMDSYQRKRAILGLRGSGEPYLSLLDHNGQVRAVLGSVEFTNELTGSSEKRPCSSLVLFDEQGRIIWSAPLVKSFPVQLSEKKQ